MPQFRKKPVEIEAHHFTGWTKNGDPIFDTDPTGPLFEAMQARVVNWACEEFFIETLEGRMYAEVNDWIIRGVKGEFYPIKPDIFAETYELVV